jgi:hypothetical protein
MSICTFVEYGSQFAPFTAKMTKIKYCELSQLGCARFNAYQVMDADLVPDDLWPNAEIKTLELIERKIKESHQPLHNSRGVDD